MLRFGVLSADRRNFGISRFYRFARSEPYGIKDPAIRAVVVAAMHSGDTTRAGILVTPGEAVRQLCAAGRRVKPRAQVDPRARARDPGPRG